MSNHYFMKLLKFQQDNIAFLNAVYGIPDFTYPKHNISEIKNYFWAYNKLGMQKLYVVLL
jgi:hypothetical protein